MRLLYEHAVRDESGLILLRSKLRAVSRRMGYTELVRERMELVYNEMVTNQLKFAEGSGVVQLWETDVAGKGLELFALDYGPGILDVESASIDGFTTAGTMGKGLGAIRRLCRESSIYSVHKGSSVDDAWHGTAVWAKFPQDKVQDKNDALRYGMYVRSYQDNLFNGDCIYIHRNKNQFRWLHMDGLGHGEQAADTVKGLQDIVRIEKPIQERLEILNSRLQGSRGSVAIMVDVDTSRDTVSICGIGDMTCYLMQDEERQSVGFSQGILGHAHRSINVVDLPFNGNAVLYTASDGIRRNWTLDSFPKLWKSPPQLISFFLGYMIGRSNDDKSIMILSNTY